MKKENIDDSPYGIAYTFLDFYIPNYMMGGIKRYIEQGISPGDFLTAIICNDLSGAVSRADETNIKNLPAYVAYFYNNAPGVCWGNVKKMVAWQESFHKENQDD